MGYGSILAFAAGFVVAVTVRSFVRWYATAAYLRGSLPLSKERREMIIRGSFNEGE